MEKEEFVLNDAGDSAIHQPNWNPMNFGSEIQSTELNCFLNPNWENSVDQNDPFESALSSIVSSPAASNAVPGGGARNNNNIAMGELIGKLGSICNSDGGGGGGDISPPSYINSTNNSCYSTPLNSPPKLNLSVMDQQLRGALPIPAGNNFPAFAPFPADPGFAERAARFSCFGNGNFGGLNPNFGFNESEMPYRLMPRAETDKLSRVSSNQSLKMNASQLGNLENKKGFSDSDRKLGRVSGSDNAEFGDSREESSISEQIPAGDLSLKDQIDCNGRKRKSIPRGKIKDSQFPPNPPAKADAKGGSENEESSAKRSKSGESSGNEKGKIAEANGSSRSGGAEGNQKQSKDSAKPPEPPKDYIHVRARRGQATDSHSLAERVRREKISERMKFLQDLVPGCNKVTGKAVMLDEIINYVQSLQRQVEFLSMKLATVNPRGEFAVEALISKDVLQSRGQLRETMYPFDSSVYTLQSQQGPSLPSSISNGTQTQFSINSLNAAMHRNPSMQLAPMNGYGEAASQGSTFWQDDLQSVVQMGLAQNQPQTLHGSGSQLKIEL